MKPRFSEFSQFHPEWDSVEATIIRGSDDLFTVNVIQEPGIVVGAGHGKTSTEAAENAGRIAELLNNHGL